MTLADNLTVIGAELAAAHPELHHYTDRGGFEGIVRTNTLWATHYGDLNDSAEVVHLRDRLRGELVTRFRDIVRIRQSTSLKIRRAAREVGGLDVAARGLADDLIRSLYNSAFISDEARDHDSKTAGTPYIGSLCTHATGQYEQANGLLSQWRAYGRGGGFCLVFDTAALGERLGRESDAFGYSHLNLHPAQYAFDDVSVAELFPDLVATCERFVETALGGEAQLGDGIAQFFVAATVLKHQAFHEENEVRIVGIPISGPFRELVLQENPGAVIGEVKAVRALDRASGPKRYIALFESLHDALPIKRVIVGPSNDQAGNLELARSLCGDIPVVASQTPYKG